MEAVRAQPDGREGDRMRDYDDPSEPIGELLARVRADRGVSQLRLAERLCAASGTATVTRNEISRWERGDRVPSGYWLAWLAAVLELPLERLERAVAVSRRQRRRSPWAPPTWLET